MPSSLRSVSEGGKACESDCEGMLVTVDEAKLYRTGQHNEVPKPLSLKRNADLPLLRKNASAQTGLQEENPMALQHLH